jgi:hypothetical protein
MAAIVEHLCFVISVTGLDRPCNRDDDDDDDSYEFKMLVFL